MSDIMNSRGNNINRDNNLGVDVHTLLGQCENLLSEMTPGELRTNLSDIQDILQRNEFLIKEMDSAPLSGNQDFYEQRALRTMELRLNMIELVR
jgi:hypothetical protein